VENPDGVATISMLHKNIGLFCKRALYSAKETYHFKEPTNRSHPIAENVMQQAVHSQRTWKIYMGWFRLVDSLKLQVSFAEYRLFYRALLQKSPIILRILLTVATPYRCFTFSENVQPVAFGVSFPISQISINDLVLQVSCATFS